MLDNFFTINLPYGLIRNDDGSWMPFNRERMSLGYNTDSKPSVISNPYNEYPYYTEYLGLTENIFLDLADEFERDKKGKIVKIYFYSPSYDPTAQNFDSDAVWNRYFNKIRTLSKLKVK